MGSSGPLGKYSQQVAAILSLGIVAAAIAARFLGINDVFLNNLALIAVGAVFGAAATTSVNGNKIEAAHRRLDLIAAPPSDYMEHKTAMDQEYGGK